jgi:hypothetical protein
VAEAECDSPQGAAVTLDGSASTDPNSTPGTDDSITAHDWFEDYGAPDERLLGSGQVLAVPLSVGSHEITLKVTNRFGETDTDELIVQVTDSVAPHLSVSLSPTTLWPPNHRMVEVDAVLSAEDLCGPPDVLLASVSSSEPDNAVGTGDGDTVNDIQAADVGTPDFEFSLRAERSGSGDGRTYTVTYTAADSAGNESSAMAIVDVPHDQGGVTEPVGVSLEENGNGTLVEWAKIPGANSYNVIRGSLANIRNLEPAYDLGTVTCIEANSGNESTAGDEDGDQPGPGEVFFYLVAYNDGQNSSYSTESAAKPRLPRVGNCPQ